MAEVLSLDIEVADDSILAHKQITVRPMRQAKLKHIRAAQRGHHNPVHQLSSKLDRWKLPTDALY